jgi:NADH-ubiquinone oxidoreductase chain 4
MFIFTLLSAPVLGLLYTLSKLNYKKFDNSYKYSDLSIPQEKVTSWDYLSPDQSTVGTPETLETSSFSEKLEINTSKTSDFNNVNIKNATLQTSIIALWISIFMFSIFDFSTNQFQFVREYHKIDIFNLHLGIDGLSMYFILLIAIIIPISLLSNWTSITKNERSYLITILLLDILLSIVFMALDILLFYIFFESILIPLFILIGLFGSDNRVRASFYLFLYTLLGSLFLLLSILAMFSIMSVTDLDALYKMNFNYYTQILLFCGIFIAFAVKTPTIFLNVWLLKAHVESPLSGSIILAAIVLKLSLYGIFRIILPLLPKSYFNCTYFIYLVGVITIIYASISTLRTTDVKELIAYSSVSHAAVYLMAVFSNTIKGIEGSILLGLAHGFVSSGLFICAGGILYDRSSTRLITHYRGIAQIMPVFCIMFFILCLGNCGVPLTLNFVGEFLSLYGAVERSPLLGALASSSIIFSAAYTIYMFNRIAFAGSYSKFFYFNIIDVNKREFIMLSVLIILTIILGIYPNFILDGIHYSVTTLIYDMPTAILFIPFSLKKIKS